MKVLRSSPLCTNSGTHMYPESTTLITEIEETVVPLRPETYIEWSIALMKLGKHLARDVSAGEMTHRHNTFYQRWFNVGPPSTTLDQCETNVDAASCVCWGVGELLAQASGGWLSTHTALLDDPTFNGEPVFST